LQVNASEIRVVYFDAFDLQILDEPEMREASPQRRGRRLRRD
jgi:hypothetical protein